MKEMKLTENELSFLSMVVDQVRKKFRKEEKTVLLDISPGFMKGEVRYEEFMKNLAKKLEN